MSTHILALPDDRALATQADRLRRAHATLLAALARPSVLPADEAARTREFRSLELELTSVESRIGVASALARFAERAERAASRLLGLRPRWSDRYSVDDLDDLEADQETTATAANGRRGRAA
jgi:hypothetical protein